MKQILEIPGFLGLAITGFSMAIIIILTVFSAIALFQKMPDGKLKQSIHVVIFTLRLFSELFFPDSHKYPKK